MVKFIGAVLILAGIAGFAYGVTHGGLRWSRQDRAVASDSEAVQVKGYSLPLAPIAGATCLVAGIIVLIVGARQRA
jgi:ABC-type Fe3+ transport system permease subunit